MKLLSKIQLIGLAIEVFKQYPDQEKCFAREDGNIFFEENHAELGKDKLKIYALEKADILPAKSEDSAPDKPVTTAKPTTPAPAKKVIAPAKKVDTTIGKDGKNPEIRTSNETV